MKIFFTLLFGGYAVLLCAQKHDYVWMSGSYYPSDSLSGNYILDFHTFPPKIDRFYDSLIMGSENISMSDFDGKLQFYTNGCIIRAWDKSTMEGGDFINGGPTNSFWAGNCGPNGFGSYPELQGIFGIPFVYKMDELFYTKVNPSPSQGVNLVCKNEALLYSRIDMNANQGLGKVVFKDSTLIEGCFQTAFANRHANGRDWWVLLPDNLQQRFYRFLSTPEGVQGPWIQDFENPTILDSFFYIGWGEFAPNGEHLLINDIQTGTAIYDFDRCTGLLSNLRYIPAENDQYGYGYAAAFAPDSRHFYIVKGNFRRIDQFDLGAPILEASRTTIATWDGSYDYFEPNGPPLEASFAFFQHGPDGKLYIWAGGTRYMHVMNFPNQAGIGCAFQYRALSLPYYNNGANLYYPNYRLGPIDNSSCDTLGINNLPQALFRYDLEDTLSPLQVTFTDVSSYLPTAWHWDFGDGAVSQDTNPVHTYDMSGTYQVCLIVSNPYAADTFCQQVQVGTVGIHELPALPYVTVSPNPFSNEIKVQLPARVGVNPQFVLHDLLGREIKSVVLDDFETILSLAGSPSGMYVWQLRWKGVATQSGRVVKM